MVNKNLSNTEMVEILLIEDNKADILLMQKALVKTDLKTSITVIRNGDDAIKYLTNNIIEHNNIPNLILLDLNLPKKDGFEVLKEIKSNNNLKRIPVIILTASSSKEDINKAYDMSANSYIVKPVKFRDFILVVQRLKDFWVNTVELPNV